MRAPRNADHGQGGDRPLPSGNPHRDPDRRPNRALGHSNRPARIPDSRPVRQERGGRDTRRVNQPGRRVGGSSAGSRESDRSARQQELAPHDPLNLLHRWKRSSNPTRKPDPSADSDQAPHPRSRIAEIRLSLGSRTPRDAMIKREATPPFPLLGNSANPPRTQPTIASCTDQGRPVVPSLREASRPLSLLGNSANPPRTQTRPGPLARSHPPAGNESEPVHA